MRNLRYKFEKEIFPFEQPEGWHDVPYRKYVQYLTTPNMSVVDTLELFLGIPRRLLEKPMSFDFYDNMLSSINFITTAPKELKPKYILLPDERIVDCRTTLTDLTVGNYQDMLILLNQVVSKEKSTLTDKLLLIPKLIGIFGLRDYKTHEIEDYSELIMDQPTDVVNSFGNFYIRQYANLKNNTKKTWFHRILTTLISKLVTKTSGINMDLR